MAKMASALSWPMYSLPMPLSHLIWCAMFLSATFFVSCSEAEDAVIGQELVGPWLLTLDLNGNTLPVNVLFAKKSETYSLVFTNGEERIEVDEVEVKDDSIWVTMPLYDSKFFGKLSRNGVDGRWVNYVKGKDYSIPFKAEFGVADRFPRDEDGICADLGGKWEVEFQYKDSSTNKAIGLFKQHGDHVTGTFLTETGDYRYLEGRVVDNQFTLSCFDGSHAFLFSGTLHNDRISNGQFLSGTHWSCTWSATRNEQFKLRDPDSLTYLKEGYDMVDFALPNLKGDTISPKNDQFQNKVLLVQIMGSWCPNCADETALLHDVYEQYHDQGLEIVALAFERDPYSPRTKKRIQRMIDHFGVQYDVLIAGPSNKASATATLPFLDNIISYPTCIFIDRKGVVRKVHAGFSGPGTGKHYTNYVAHMDKFLSMLLAEEHAASTH